MSIFPYPSRLVSSGIAFGMAMSILAAAPTALWAADKPATQLPPLESKPTLKNDTLSTGISKTPADVEETHVPKTQPSDKTNLDTVDLQSLQNDALAAFQANQYPIDLATVLKLVEAQNLTIAQSQKNTEVLQSRYRQSQAALLPNIDASYVQSRLEGGQQIFGSVQTVTRKTIQPQIGVSWTLYPGGQNIFSMLAARQRKKAADQTFEDTLQNQLSLATQNYYSLIAAHQQKNVVASSLAQALEQVQSNEAKVKTGKGIPLDLSRAVTNYVQQKTALVQADNAIIQAEQTLLNQLNIEPVIHLVPPPTIVKPETLADIEALKKPLVKDSVTIDTMLATAVKNNPAVLSGTNTIKAMDYDYKTTRSNLIPSVTLRTYISKTGQQWDNLLRTEFAGLTVNVNLLQNLGLMIPFQMQEKKKLLQQQNFAQQQLMRDVQTQVMTAYLNSENYKSVIESSKQEVASAKDSYDLASGRFKAGYGLNIDVLDAQTALATARNNLVQAILSYNQAQVQLVEALGMISGDNIMGGVQTPLISNNTPALNNSNTNNKNTKGTNSNGQ